MPHSFGHLVLVRLNVIYRVLSEITMFYDKLDAKVKQDKTKILTLHLTTEHHEAQQTI